VLGFKRFSNARRVLAGVDLVQKIIKGQFQVPERVLRFLGSSMIVNVARYSCAGYSASISNNRRWCGVFESKMSSPVRLMCLHKEFQLVLATYLITLSVVCQRARNGTLEYLPSGDQP
jgi:hypothetical protein